MNPGAVKIVVLLLLAFFKDGTIKESTIPLPQGTTVADCIADHQPALAANWDASVIKFGWACVEVDAVPASES